MDFAHYQSPKLVCSSPPMTKLKIWDRPLANIRYIDKISDGRQKVKFTIIWDFPTHENQA